MLHTGNLFKQNKTHAYCALEIFFVLTIEYECLEGLLQRVVSSGCHLTNLTVDVPPRGGIFMCSLRLKVFSHIDYTFGLSI